jgi:glucan phosphoethanolaminetransferase (alkaline phosphatase superfamily)
MIRHGNEPHPTNHSKEVMTIRLYVFPFIPIAIIAALAFLWDRSMEYSLIQKEATLAVIIVSLLTLLVLVLLIYLQRKNKNRKGGPSKSNE